MRWQGCKGCNYLDGIQELMVGMGGCRVGAGVDK